MTELLLVEDLEIAFAERGRLTNRPVRGVSFSIGAGEVLGVVGETGCGKSLTGLAVLGMLPEGAQPNGRILLYGVEQRLDRPSPVRGDAISIVFQNPGTAFNPVFTLGHQLRAVLARHRRATRTAMRERILEYFAHVGLPEPERVYDSYPHELSGGMLQRVMIAQALICEPKLLILDEPTTALDVTIARQILRLILSLRDRFGFGVLLITHNLGVVQEVCDTVAVLYAGRVVEQGPADAVLAAPSHPYTRGLLGALPARHARGTALEAIRGSVPANLLGITGCVFADRCPLAQERCYETDPMLRPVGALREAACVLVGEEA
ncbi:ABC transporter ATP-binding protein [Microbacterium pseudoresistens]|uniref:Peptide/nickel transport system ATP-binding protein n=1 Tax=Microbacterium pseudoresistens TaxID=640634 RepID=A0A7Y9JL21_9MICO|nr:ABC transporter ATP-binding protein [Microbacterium pseudoresistens]NYD53212.1 peptide/nickel transport system ATP-binding protein [Microbacterium pseudoresistens]